MTPRLCSFLQMRHMPHAFIGGLFSYMIFQFNSKCFFVL